MATINGTAAADNLVGTTSNDILFGLGGNDTLNGGGGDDQIFGFGEISPLYFRYNGKFYLLSNAGTWTQAQAQAVTLGGNLVTVNDAAENQFLVNTFGGTERLWIGLTDEVTEGTFKWANGEAVTYTNWASGEPNNLNDEDYVEFNLRGAGKWNDLPNSLRLLRGIIEIANPSNDTIIGSTGNDTINGAIGQDTADYSAIGQAITLKPTGVVTKGTAGTDQLVGIENIIGATGLTNIIDASTATGTATINANLATKSLVVNTGDSAFPTLSFSVNNFVNVIGTVNNDTITGDDGNNNLAGGNGNDTLNGGGGNDQIFGDVSVPYFTYNGKFYLLSNAGTWTQAQAQAVTLGGNLVTVNDAAENQFLVNTFGGTERLWIGLTDEVTEGTFKWANGEAVTYTNWASGEPNNLNDEDYVEFNLRGAGKWNDLPNSLRLLRGIIEIANPSNDTIIGSTGNDTINGAIGQDTADYSAIGQAITLKPTGVVTKGTAGTDQLVGIENIIGATGLTNIIDASTATDTATINANLANKSLVVNTGDSAFPTLSFSVNNFVTVIGTANNDTITGDDGNNILVGNGGNDILTGNGGNDTLSGSTGDDTINGGLGSDTVNYSSLTEAITLLAGGIVNKGSFGTDKIIDVETVIGATGQSNTIDASTGIATTTSLNVNLATNSLIINGLPAPVNSITLNVQNFLNVVGTTQNDTIRGNNLANELVGNTGNDTIQGNDGNDILDGGDGNDQLFGGNNDDQLFGGLGNDILQGDNGNDFLNGDLGNDTLRGLAGDDILDGGVGNDSLLGGVGNDILFGDFGDDILNAEAGNDLVFGDDGNDRLYGGDGLDELNGGIGKDFLYGGNNNDTLFGNDDNDTLWGEAGDDILNGGKGNDILVGGANNDVFVIALSNGADIVQDFQDGFDRIGLSGGLLFSQLTILGTGTNTVIRNTSSGEIFATLQNVSSTLITSFDFTVV